MEKIPSKCKNCGSELWYNPAQGCLSCKHCESNYYLPQQNRSAILTRQYSPDFHPNELNRGLNAYRCKSCGTVYFLSSDGTSKRCANCGLQSGELIDAPGLCADGIIPFKISKEEASARFEEYLKKQHDIPKELKKYARDQKLMGVFIPVWNFSFGVSGYYTASATELHKSPSGNYYSTYKPVYGDKFKQIKSHDVSATNTEDDIFLKLFDEDDYAEIIPYTPEYTFGYRVDTIDRNISECCHAVTHDAEQEMEDDLKKEVLSRFKEVSDINVETQVQDIYFNFTYVPVYVNTYTYKGKIYKTYISGTTGKAVGKSPTTFKKVLRILLKAALIIGGIALVIYLISRLF